MGEGERGRGELEDHGGLDEMKAYDAASTIEAAPETVWAILTDAPGYSTWDSGVERVEGRIAPGEKIKVLSKPIRGAPFPSA
jgi:hypothetical protein